jgi:single-stranded DNA-binding protein
MIDALIAGKLYGSVAERTAKNGNRFATAKVRTATAAGEAIFVNVIVFTEAAVMALLALSDGDSVALSGELTPKVWLDKNGKPRPVLDLVAHAVLTAYHVIRKRKALQGEAP